MNNTKKPKTTILVVHEDTFKNTYFEKCIGQTIRSSKLASTLPDWQSIHLDSPYPLANYIVTMYEDMVLQAMRSKDDPAYKKLEADMTWISQRLNCNVTVYLGHLEVCDNYILTEYKKMASEMPTPDLPTVFLIIGCYGTKIAQKYNTEPVFVEKKIGFFGFNLFMHVIHGEIYGCEGTHKTSISMTCDYDTIEEDLVKLLEIDKNGAKKTVSNVKTKSIDKENPLVKCCEAKEAAIYDNFLTYLEQRNCVKFPKEKLAEKFAPFAQSGDRSFLTDSQITQEYGIQCKEGKCETANPYAELAPSAKVFNAQSRKRKLYLEVLGSWKEGAKEFKEKIEKLSIEDGYIFTYRYDEKPVIFTQLLENKRRNPYTLENIYEIALSIVKKFGKKITFDARTSHGENGNSILHSIIKSKLPEGKQYFLFEKLYQSLAPENRESIFLSINEFGQIPLLATDSMPYLMLWFYTQHFGSKLKDVRYRIPIGFRGNLLHGVLITFYEDYFDYVVNIVNKKDIDFQKIKLIMNCIIALLENGVDPNQRLARTYESNSRVYEPLTKEQVEFLESLKPLQLYTFLYPPTYDPKLFDIFLTYGMTNDDKFFTKKFEEYSTLAKNYTAHLNTVETKLSLLEKMLNNNLNEKSNIVKANSDILIYKKFFSNQLPFIKKSFTSYRNIIEHTHGNAPTAYERGEPVLEVTAQLFQKCVLFFAIQSRKNYKKRINNTRSKLRKNLNNTTLKYKKKMNLTYNAQKYAGIKRGEMLEFLKRAYFTREEKDEWKQTIQDFYNMLGQNSNYRSGQYTYKDIFELLESAFESMKNQSKNNEELYKLYATFDKEIKKLPENNANMKTTWIENKKEIESDPELYNEEKVEKMKKLLKDVTDYLNAKPIFELQDKIYARLNLPSFPNNQRQAYKNRLQQLSNNNSVLPEEYKKQLEKILREISV